MNLMLEPGPPLADAPASNFTPISRAAAWKKRIFDGARRLRSAARFLSPKKQGEGTNMSDTATRERERGYRVIFDGAIVAAVVMQIVAGFYWAGIIHQQMQDVTQRVDGLEHIQSQRTTALTDIAVKLGRIDQKLADIGQKVGTP